MQYTIETNNLTKIFGAYTAVDHINVQVRSGEIFGFLGANGAGKTTAIRMLCGLLEPTSGSGQVAGFDIMKETSKIRWKIGYMSQKFSLYGDMTVLDNMKLFGSLYGLSKTKLVQRIDEMSQLLELSDLQKRVTGSLPWGWQQRLSLACANAPSAPHSFSRRTHRIGRSGQPQEFLGPHTSAFCARHHHFRYHASHGRSGILPSDFHHDQR